MDTPASHISWTGEFVDAQQERVYAQSTARRSLSLARLSIIATTVTSLSFTPMDVLGVAADRLPFFLGDRLLIALVCLGALAALTRFQRAPQVTAITYLQQYAFFTLNALVFNHPALMRHGGALLPLIAISLFVILPGSFRAAALLCAYASGVSLLFWGVLRPDPESATDLSMIAMMTVVAYVVGGVARSHFGRMQREEYRHVERERQVNQTLLEAKEAAEAGSRAKASFLAVMSHEIRTPMNGVLGMVRLVLDSRLEAQDRRRLETACHSAEGLLTILDDILDISKLDAGNVEFENEPFALRQTFENVAALMDLRAREKGLRFSLDLDPALPRWVSGDSARLRQILFNLIGNAVKFTEAGSVTVRADARLLPDGMVRVAVAVSDTGIGIDPEQHGRLFQAFGQADASITRRFGGTGLGLVICQKLVAGLGGTLDFDSAPGKGSTFRFSLSFAPAQAVPELPTVAAVRPLSVLVAEDNPVNCEVAKAYLMKSGHRVTLAANGVEAVEQARTGGFDLVLMDLHMPEMDGLEAARRIRALPGPAAQVPVIAMTANAMRADIARCRSAGMDGHVAKPVTQKVLDGTIARVLAERDEGKVTADNPPLSFDVLMTGTDGGTVADDLRRLGHRVFPVAPAAARAMLAARPFDLVMVTSDDARIVSDLHHAASGQSPRPNLLVMAEHHIEALLKAGADDVLPASPDEGVLAAALARHLPARDESPDTGLETLLGSERFARLNQLLHEGLRQAAVHLSRPDLGPEELGDIAHRIKGSAANMGLAGLAAIAGTAMRAAENPTASPQDRERAHRELREAVNKAILAQPGVLPVAEG